MRNKIFFVYGLSFTLPLVVMRSMQEIVPKAFISELTAHYEKYKRLSWRDNMNHSSTVGISFSYIMPVITLRREKYVQNTFVQECMPVRGSMNKKKLSFYKSLPVVVPRKEKHRTFVVRFMPVGESKGGNMTDLVTTERWI